jgi:hypothetical protein
MAFMSNQDNITEQPTYTIEFGMQIADYMRENGCDVDTAIAACEEENKEVEQTIKLSDLQEQLSFALQLDMEAGSAWLNEQEVEKFAAKYPGINKVIGAILNLDNITPEK